MTTKTLGLMEQAAMVGRATAIDLFVVTLNPANRTRKFKWNSLIDQAAETAATNVIEFIPNGTLDVFRRAILDIATDEARSQMKEMIETSQVRRWCRK